MGCTFVELPSGKFINMDNVFSVEVVKENDLDILRIDSPGAPSDEYSAKIKDPKDVALFVSYIQRFAAQKTEWSITPPTTERARWALKKSTSMKRILWIAVAVIGTALAAYGLANIIAYFSARGGAL